MTNPQNTSRRKALKKVAVIGAAAALPPAAMTPPCAMAQPTATATATATAKRALSAIELAALEAMCARLIPSDDGFPGAKEARAADYIDRALADALAGSRKAYAAGLAALDAYSNTNKGAAFAALSAADQDAVLTAMEKNTATGFTPNATAFFNLVRNHTLQGTFCDPAYGGNANFAGWDLIGYPGIRMAVAPEEQRMSVKPKPVRQSAYRDATLAKGSSHGH